jgi:hypothetical protein
VIDTDGKDVLCGHQRPVEVLREWLAASESAIRQVAVKSPQVQEMSRRHYEDLRLLLERAEAAQHAEKHPPIRRNRQRTLPKGHRTDRPPRQHGTIRPNWLAKEHPR